MGRFINADSFVTTGQDLLGYNMFAYCNNNPANRTDASGYLSVTVSKCLISVATSIVCDIVTHASIGEIVTNAVMAAVASVFDPWAKFMTIISVVKTTLTVTQTTGDLAFGIFMGAWELGLSFCTGENIGKLPCIENFDEAAELFLDATVGLTASVISEKSVYDYTDGFTPPSVSSTPTSSTSSPKKHHLKPIVSPFVMTLS